MRLYNNDYEKAFGYEFAQDLEWLDYYFAVYTRFIPSDKKIKRLKDYAKGKRCFIIGNGPSLNKIDLTLLKNEITFGVNSIFLNFDKMGFQPTYFVLEDKLVAKERAEDINKYVIDSNKIIRRNYFDSYKKDTKTSFIDIIVHYQHKDFPCFSKECDKFCWSGGTVSYVNMQLAYYFGFQEVYLIGFDHEYREDGPQKIKGSKIRSLAKDSNHFHPQYFGEGKTWHFPKVERMERSYRKAKEVFEESGRKIYNATVGGKLEVFDRVEYESLF